MVSVCLLHSDVRKNKLMGNESFPSELELQRSPIDLDNDPMIKSNFKIMRKVSVPAFGKADNREYK